MSLKKTWFSYLLWFVFALVTALITYSVLDEVLQGLYSLFRLEIPDFMSYLDIASKMVVVILTVIIVLFIHFLCGRVQLPAVPKWAVILMYIVIGFGVFAVFCALRYNAFHNACNLESNSFSISDRAMYFYELSKVGSTMADDVLSVFEQVYVNVIRILFLFFGNKMEVLLLAQLIMQMLTFVMLIVIGRVFQKGVFSWIPALLYAVAPTCFYAASDAGITNFWTLLIFFCLFVICVFEKIWKKKNITYLVMVFVQLLFIGVVFFVKKDVFLCDSKRNVTENIICGNTWILTMEMLVLVMAMITYCVSFFMDKQDHRCLFVLPVVGYSFLAIWMSNYEYEVFHWMAFVALINLFFMISQSMRTLFRTKPEVVTGNSNPLKDVETKFEWEEMKELMHSTEGVEVRVEEPVSAKLTLSEVVVDRKAPIENVLPMPKKHRPKVFDYAFEPTEDMMHFDVEIENDEYDY